MPSGNLGEGGFDFSAILTAKTAQNIGVFESGTFVFGGELSPHQAGMLGQFPMVGLMDKWIFGLVGKNPHSHNLRCLQRR
jgi:hypothetical protein